MKNCSIKTQYFYDKILREDAFLRKMQRLDIEPARHTFYNIYRGLKNNIYDNEC